MFVTLPMWCTCPSFIYLTRGRQLGVIHCIHLILTPWSAEKKVPGELCVMREDRHPVNDGICYWLSNSCTHTYSITHAHAEVIADKHKKWIWTHQLNKTAHERQTTWVSETFRNNKSRRASKTGTQGCWTAHPCAETSDTFRGSRCESVNEGVINPIGAAVSKRPGSVESSSGSHELNITIYPLSPL